MIFYLIFNYFYNYYLLNYIFKKQKDRKKY